MQHLMKLLEWDQYIHWHKLKDEDVVCDIFWCHPDAMKLAKSCNLVFLIDSTYKTNRYRLPLLDFVGATPTGMTFSTDFAYLEGERLNNVVWALECFQGIFLSRNILPGVIVTDRDLALMNVVKTETLVDCPSEQQFDKYLKRVESAHWALKKMLQNSLGDLFSVWDVMNNMMTLQHMEIRASFETSTRVVGHVFKKTLYKSLLGMVSRYALNQIAAEFERVHYAGNNPSSCGCVMRMTHGLPCACELSKYVVGCIPLDSIHMFWRRLSFSDQGISKPEVSIKEEIETISKRFDELDVCGKFTLKTKLWGIVYPDQNSMCPPPAKQNSNSSVRRSSSSSDQPNPRRMMPMLDQFQLFIHDFIDNIVDVGADGNCGYRAVAGLLEDYIKLFGGTDKFEDLRMPLHVDGLTMVTMDKWMDVTDMGYVITSRYNVILVSLSHQQSITLFPLRSQPLGDPSVHHIICIDHVYDNHFVQEHCNKEGVVNEDELEDNALEHCNGEGSASEDELEDDALKHYIGEGFIDDKDEVEDDALRHDAQKLMKLLLAMCCLVKNQGG
ncbi:hypothetical protein GmHk_15G044919 [Glycine max]|nr:hypothetical protein GmHk_15G044919 [Glycine max]